MQGNQGKTSIVKHALIATFDGRCDAWARFFIDVLRAQGGNFSYYGTQATPTAPAAPANLRAIRVSQAAAATVSGFLVKEWNFVGNGNAVPNTLGYTHANRVTGFDDSNLINGNQYAWVGGNANAGFTDQPGIDGQNSPNPQSLFPSHMVVQIGNILYDPSYGATYDWTANNPLGDFQTKAIAGFFNNFTAPNGLLYIRARRPSVTVPNEINNLFSLNTL